ncbi:MAG: hypothetical protein OXU23_02120 [Candidatus Poribacteria bacterium]|nr:hypothetical protein [Candidatus Poribacteria bacterium]
MAFIPLISISESRPVGNRSSLLQRESTDSEQQIPFMRYALNIDASEIELMQQENDVEIGEWNRLVKDAYNSLEFLLTMHHLRKHLPETGRILDAGGGPGRYTPNFVEQVMMWFSWILT